tara:strand:- start:1077 stop:1466 length:390 start_codon:yes stop_codon:yes gene_type:complete
MAYKHNTVEYGFGQMGSVFNDTANPCKAPIGKVFVAITFLVDTTLEAHGGLIAEQDSSNGLEFISTEDAAGNPQTAHDIAHGSDSTALSGAGGVVVDNSNTFPKGLTIYGRWSEIHSTATGGYIAYIGD